MAGSAGADTGYRYHNRRFERALPGMDLLLDAFAVVGDRAWMTDSQNHTYTVYVGQKMPDNRTVYAADENEQAIWVK